MLGVESVLDVRHHQARSIRLLPPVANVEAEAGRAGSEVVLVGDEGGGLGRNVEGRRDWLGRDIGGLDAGVGLQLCDELLGIEGVDLEIEAEIGQLGAWGGARAIGQQ